jgi:hypothetical protein
MEKRYLVKVKCASDKKCWYCKETGQTFLVEHCAWEPDCFVIVNDTKGFYKKDVDVLVELSVDDDLFKI